MRTVCGLIERPNVQIAAHGFCRFQISGLLFSGSNFGTEFQARTHATSLLGIRFLTPQLLLGFRFLTRHLVLGFRFLTQF